MAVMLKLKPEVEANLRKKAEREGLDFTDFLQSVVEREAQEEEEEEPAGSAYDLFAGRIGRIQGSSEAFSQNCGERFTQYVVEKHKAGNL